MDEYALVHLLTSSKVEFIAKTEKPPEVPKGSTIGFGIKADLAHFFDPNSGARLTLQKRDTNRELPVHTDAFKNVMALPG